MIPLAWKARIAAAGVAFMGFLALLWQVRRNGAVAAGNKALRKDVKANERVTNAEIEIATGGATYTERLRGLSSRFRD